MAHVTDQKSALVRPRFLGACVFSAEHTTIVLHTQPWNLLPLNVLLTWSRHSLVYGMRLWLVHSLLGFLTVTGAVPNIQWYHLISKKKPSQNQAA